MSFQNINVSPIIFSSKLLFTIVLLLALSLASYANSEKEIVLTVAPIELSPNVPQQKTIGKLKFIKGYNLSSSYSHFGGISGLSNSKQSGDIKVHIVSDRGQLGYLKLDRNYKPYSASLSFIRNIPWDSGYGKIADAESVSQLQSKSDKYILVSFEGVHRIMAYSTVDKIDIAIPLPPEIRMLQSNGSLETMEVLKDGRLFLMAEHPIIKNEQHLAWIGTAPKEAPLNFRYITRLMTPPLGYSPTDATQLPNGDVLVLLRRFSASDGISAKFWRIKKSMINKSGPITGEVIATIKPPFNVDNMEGIAVIDISTKGNPIIAVISDDNYNPLQRTLLMIFEVFQ